eukprot:s298_g6.t1
MQLEKLRVMDFAMHFVYNGAKEAALSAELALARGNRWYTGHGSGWQQDALGQVAMTLDLLSWHGRSLS